VHTWLDFLILDFLILDFHFRGFRILQGVLENRDSYCYSWNQNLDMRLPQSRRLV